jgi:hypothetical protein
MHWGIFKALKCLYRMRWLMVKFTYDFRNVFLQNQIYMYIYSYLRDLYTLLHFYKDWIDNHRNLPDDQ